MFFAIVYASSNHGLRIKESDILIWKALHEYGGLYIIAPTFKIDTICCSQETFDDHKNWTVSEYLQMERELDPGQDMIYYMDLEEFSSSQNKTSISISASDAINGSGEIFSKQIISAIFPDNTAVFNATSACSIVSAKSP